MFGLSPLGVLHTLISIAAVAFGVAALGRHKQISWRTPSGRAYVVLTIATCATGFFIFRHGVFREPHALGVLTSIVLGFAMLAELRGTFGRLAPYVASLGYTTTLFFHMIPAVAETATRLPLDAPLAATQEDPIVLATTGLFFVVYLIIAGWQVVRLRGGPGRVPLSSGAR